MKISVRTLLLILFLMFCGIVIYTYYKEAVDNPVDQMSFKAKTGSGDWRPTRMETKFADSKDKPSQPSVIIEPDDVPSVVEQSFKDTKIINILYWNEFYGDKNYGFCCGKSPYKKFRCANKNCRVNKKREDEGGEKLEAIDAIIFHQRTFSASDLPKKRYPWQYYIFYSLEAPPYDNVDWTEWRDFFNLTMTYRLDSDIPAPYGYVDAQPKQSGGNASRVELETMVRGKSSLIAWFVSHCSTVSMREDFVEELKTYLPPDSIDVYGSCGSLQCPRQQPAISHDSSVFSNQPDPCFAMAERKYYFYLSFENAVCKDYVTEKLYKAMQYNLVPVVLGGGDYVNQLPAKSFVNAADFDSPKELADFLTNLADNKTEYLKYFDWKQTHAVKNSKMDINRAHCSLCQFLHQNQGQHKVIHDIHDWWKTKAQCQNT